MFGFSHWVHVWDGALDPRKGDGARRDCVTPDNPQVLEEGRAVSPPRPRRGGSLPYCSRAPNQSCPRRGWWKEGTGKDRLAHVHFHVSYFHFSGSLCFWPASDFKALICIATLVYFFSKDHIAWPLSCQVSAAHGFWFVAKWLSLSGTLKYLWTA